MSGPAVGAAIERTTRSEAIDVLDQVPTHVLPQMRRHHAIRWYGTTRFEGGLRSSRAIRGSMRRANPNLSRVVRDSWSTIADSLPRGERHPVASSSTPPLGHRRADHRTRPGELS